MLEARMVQASLLKKVVDSIKDLINCATFEFSEEGLSLQSLDTSHCCLVFLQIQSDGFDFYRCDKNKSISLSIQNFAKVLHCANNEDTITLKAKDDSDVLSLLVENKEMDRIMDFDLKLMDMDVEQLEIPSTEYTSSLVMSSTEFKKMIGDLAQLGDTCQIQSKKDSFEFSVDGDLGKATITLCPSSAADDNNRTQINVEDPTTNRFAVHFISAFAKATPLSNTAKLQMTHGVPLRVEYTIEGCGCIAFFVAPKVKEAGSE